MSVPRQPEAIGPVETPAWPETIASENVSQIADAETMRTLDYEQSNAVHAGIATALWQALVTRALSPESFGSALSRATPERHLRSTRRTRARRRPSTTRRP